VIRRPMHVAHEDASERMDEDGSLTGATRECRRHPRAALTATNARGKPSGAGPGATREPADEHRTEHSSSGSCRRRASDTPAPPPPGVRANRSAPQRPPQAQTNRPPRNMATGAPWGVPVLRNRRRSSNTRARPPRTWLPNLALGGGTPRCTAVRGAHEPRAIACNTR